MQNKLHANKFYMPTMFFKMLYVQSYVADNALAQINTQLGEDTVRAFKTTEKILNMLMTVFDNKNYKQEACIEYKALQ